MLAEKEYPIRAGTLTVMLCTTIRVHEDNEKVRELLHRLQDYVVISVENHLSFKDRYLKYRLSR